MQPRNEVHQRCLSFSLNVTPAANIMQYRDFMGNTVHHFDIAGKYETVKITAQSLVEVLDWPAPAASEAGAWEDLDALIATEDHWEMLLPSHFAQPTAALKQFALELGVRREGNPLELLFRLNQAIYEAFSYVPNSTKVDSPIDDALSSRQGVCQDFAHIMISLLRELRVPCRYISGYLYQTAKKDRSTEGASHAWVEALVPKIGWVAFDPTNNLVGSDRHVRVAIGRDYADVPPTRGVYKGEARSELSVGVTVALSDAPLPEQLAPMIIQSPAFSGTGNMRSYEQQQQQQQ
jgi:transglutaminase-like putative cysteine protease